MDGHDSTPPRVARRFPPAIFVALGLTIAVLGYVAHARARDRYLSEKGAELRAIADLKVSQILAWRAERLADARATAADPLLIAAVRDWLGAGARSERAGALQARLGSLRDAYGYERVSLLDAQGSERLSAPGGEQERIAADELARQARATPEASFLDLHRHDTAEGIHLEVVAPLRLANDPGPRPVAFVVFQSDPRRFLYPLVQSWPTPSRTGETLLVRREGSEVLYLNPLRHRSGTALTLRLPVAQPELPSGLAAQGREGVIEGMDYRNQRVLAALRQVPGSPWFLVSKVDREELVAPLARDAWLMALLAASMVALTGLGARRSWRRSPGALDAQLLESESRYRALAETSRDDIFVVDPEGRLSYLNAGAAARFGRDPGELQGRDLGELFPPPLSALMKADVRRVASTGQPIYGEHAVAFPGGSAWLGTWLVRLDVGEAVGAVMGVSRDITERKRAEEALVREERVLNELITTIPDNIYVKDRDSRFLKINNAMARWFGLSDPKEAVGKTDRDFFTEEHARQAYADEQRVMDTGEPQLGLEERETWPDGSVTWVSTSKVPIRDASGQIVGLVGVSRDITEHRRAEESLRESARVLLESQRVARLGSYRVDLASGTWTSSAVLDEIFGIADPGFGRDVPAWLSVVHPDQRAEMAAYFTEEVLGKGQIFNREYRIVRLSDGEERWVHGLGRLVVDREGRLVEMVGTIQDITERKRLEAHLRQAQKMEAVGQLAGGVAHDFNNLLGVIGGYSEMVLRGLPAGHPQRKRIEEIRKAGERAAGLTQQLLAFGRRQAIAPVVLDLSQVVSGLEGMLRRLIPAHIQIVTTFDSGAARVKADRGQVEQVILNLVVNARDAMPDGGRVVIETSLAELDRAYCQSHAGARPGRYVLLAVSDTGTGMDDATQAHIFEPFFTTKEVGKGTGLGLATVYGIVKQHEGYIWVYSELGRGTTFEVYFPRLDDAVAAGAGQPAPGPEAPTGSGTILLVEDDEALRELTREILEDLGYRVLEARDGEAALKASTCYEGAIDLVLTDMVMPGMTGRQIVERVRSARSGLKVLFISGYTNDVVIRSGDLDVGTAFLQKPFTPDSLGRKVREVLGAPPAA